MRGDVIAEVASWLEDPAIGVNVLRTDVPRPAGEAPPPLVGIFNAAEHPWVARNEIDLAELARGALLTVRLYGTADVDEPIAQPTGRNTVVVAISYIALLDQSATLLEDSDRTLRCAERTLSLKFPRTIGAMPERHQVLFGAPEKLSYLPMFKAVGTAMLADALLVYIPVVDRWARAVVRGF